MAPDRRTTLRLAGAGLVGALAGCLDGLGDGNGNGNGTPDGTPDDTPDGTPTEPSVTDTETQQYRIEESAPEWYDESTTGHVVVIDSEKRQDAVVRLHEAPEARRQALREFLDGVDYEESVVLLVATVGPNTCYTELDAGGFAVEEDTLVGEASAVDTSGDDEACGEAVTFPSALVRITFDGVPVTETALDITDGWGETKTVTASADDSLSPDPADLPGYVRPDGEADPIAPLSCDDDAFERHPQWADEDDVQYGEFETDGETTFALRVAETSYERGDTVEMTLTNVTDREASTGNDRKFNLQVYTEDGWQDVRGGSESSFGYTDEAIGHAPGEGFEWSIELTEEAVGGDRFEVCPDLPAGRYRFAYFGVIGDGAVAVAFDVA
ncbi:immunoglobulin-like domain-containing protein [Natronomonas gomsonensis]|uniref:immunoglobulin-like domain-containing protein n=1 Tax=Natronomonas gomsonensis TaxID=1046043 RepID=UPI0015B93B57|nr:immunoglobulin-like domain-containing protein [Natronomonas gomsonensis]